MFTFIAGLFAGALLAAAILRPKLLVLDRPYDSDDNDYAGRKD